MEDGLGAPAVQDRAGIFRPAILEQAQLRSVGPIVGCSRKCLEMGRSPSIVPMGPLGCDPSGSSAWEGQAKGRRRPGLGTKPFPIIA